MSPLLGRPWGGCTASGGHGHRIPVTLPSPLCSPPSPRCHGSPLRCLPVRSHFNLVYSFLNFLVLPALQLAAFWSCKHGCLGPIVVNGMVLSEGKGKAWAAEGAVKALVREVTSCPNPHGKCSVWVYLKKPPTVVHLSSSMRCPLMKEFCSLDAATQGRSSVGMEPSLLGKRESAVWLGYEHPCYELECYLPAVFVLLRLGKRCVFLAFLIMH